VSKRSSKTQQKRAASVAAKKERRKKVFAFGGLGVLAILMFIQGPKLLDAFGGSSEPVASALPVLPPDTTETDEDSARALRFLKRIADPFAVRSLANTDPQASAVAGPAGINDPFAASGGPDPARPVTRETQPTPVAAQVPGKIVVGTPRAGAKLRRGWIVILASIQTGAGRTFAQSFATRVRRNGLSVSVLDSSTRKPLRSGYFVVYTGPFASLAEVQRSADHVHAFGYRTAYVREILQY